MFKFFSRPQGCVPCLIRETFPRLLSMRVGRGVGRCKPFLHLGANPIRGCLFLPKRGLSYRAFQIRHNARYHVIQASFLESGLLAVGDRCKCDDYYSDYGYYDDYTPYDYDPMEQYGAWRREIQEWRREVKAKKMVNQSEHRCSRVLREPICMNGYQARKPRGGRHKAGENRNRL